MSFLSPWCGAQNKLLTVPPPWAHNFKGNVFATNCVHTSTNSATALLSILSSILVLSQFTQVCYPPSLYCQNLDNHGDLGHSLTAGSRRSIYHFGSLDNSRKPILRTISVDPNGHLPWWLDQLLESILLWYTMTLLCINIQ